jgi:hypothetical protein
MRKADVRGQRLEASEGCALAREYFYANSRMDKSCLLCLLYHRFMVATINQSEAHRNSRDWNNRNHFNTGCTTWTKVSYIVDGLSGPRLATGGSDANGVLAGRPLLKQSKQELSEKASTAG